MDRRAFLTLLAAAFSARAANALPKFKGKVRTFTYDWLQQEAERLAGETYAPMDEVPQAWRDLSYDQYKALWFNVEKALWADTDKPFHVDFFHPGLYFPRPIEVNIVEGDAARTLAFDLSLFNSHSVWPEDMPLDDSLGYSGLRLRNELVKAGRFDEFMVFQGASYFRAIGTGDTYGLSARGLALNTGEAGGEEFPEFTHFWIESPQDGDQRMIVYALLNGVSTTGAYRFEITPGQPAHIEVEATLYPRVPLDHAGIAPLTSMFLFDETNRARFDDFRSAVHDSEGLMVHNGAGELLWRPLGNPSSLQISSFVDDNPRGFGLMQRARRGEDFADLEALYHNRPSLWITPHEGWGRGSVTLVEIPSDKEIYDNIVAYWRPREPLNPGQPHRFTYAMDWGKMPDRRPRDVAKVLNTRVGKGYDKAENRIIVAVDFDDHPAFHNDGPSDGSLQDTALDGVVRFVSSNRGEVSEAILQRNPGTGGVRMGFSFDPGEATALEMRAQLVKDGKSLTEVWLYRWTAA